MQTKTDAFDIARAKTITTCERLSKGGVAVGGFGFLAGIVFARFLGWPIYGLFLGTGIFVGALIARSFIANMAARHGEGNDGGVAFKRAIVTSFALLVLWCVTAAAFDVLDERFGIDPGHVHVFWVVAIGAALANLWLVLVSSIRVWDPLGLNDAR